MLAGGGSFTVRMRVVGVHGWRGAFGGHRALGRPHGATGLSPASQLNMECGWSADVSWEAGGPQADRQLTAPVRGGNCVRKARSH